MLRVMFDWCGKYIPADVPYAPATGDVVYVTEGERTVRTMVHHREFMLAVGSDPPTYRAVIVLAPARES